MTIEQKMEDVAVAIKGLDKTLKGLFELLQIKITSDMELQQFVKEPVEVKEVAPVKEVVKEPAKETKKIIANIVAPVVEEVKAAPVAEEVVLPSAVFVKEDSDVPTKAELKEMLVKIMERQGEDVAKNLLAKYGNAPSLSSVKDENKIVLKKACLAIIKEF